jgi:hypothetical protein
LTFPTATPRGLSARTGDYASHSRPAVQDTRPTPEQKDDVSCDEVHVGVVPKASGKPRRCYCAQLHGFAHAVQLLLDANGVTPELHAIDVARDRVRGENDVADHRDASGRRMFANGIAP